MLTNINKEKKSPNLVLIFAILLGVFIIIAIFSLLFSSFEFTPFAATVAVIPVKGEISFESSAFSDSLTADEIVDRIELAEEDPSISAILLEINSGGGTIVASKRIVRKLEETEKPTVSWIADVGASGAYYVAAATDYIYADADSITGSIGVISIIPNFEEFLKEWGIKFNVLKEGEFKDMGSPFSELGEEEQALFQQLLKDAYYEFRNDIVELRGEKLNENSFYEVADGRILSGRQALKVGMIDALGTKEDALLKASELSGFSGEPAIKKYSKRTSDFSNFFSLVGYSFGKGFKEGLYYPTPSIKS